MKRGGSYGGGQSSLGYLFGSAHDHNNNKKNEQAPPAAASPPLPPYGIDTESRSSPSPDGKTKVVSNNYKGQNSGNLFITGRPSTKVKSVPGGDSSLGYLFGDK